MTTSRYRAELLDARTQAGYDPQESAQLLDVLTAGMHPGLFVTALPALGFANEQAAFGYGLDIASAHIARVEKGLPRPCTLDDAGGGAFYVNMMLADGEPTDIAYIDPTDPTGTWGSVNLDHDIEDGPHGLLSDPKTVAAWIINETIRHRNETA